jgi:CD63 antigen
VLIFIAEIAIGIAGYVKHGQLESILEVGFNKTLDKYETNLEAQKAWTLVQAEVSVAK